MSSKRSLKLSILLSLLVVFSITSVYSQGFLRRVLPKKPAPVVVKINEPIVRENSVKWVFVGHEFHLRRGETSQKLIINSEKVIDNIVVVCNDFKGRGKLSLYFNDQFRSHKPKKDVKNIGIVTWEVNLKANAISLKSSYDDVKIVSVEVNFKPIKPTERERPDRQNDRNRVEEQPGTPKVEVMNINNNRLRIGRNETSRFFNPNPAMVVEKIEVKWRSPRGAAGFLLINNDNPNPSMKKEVKGHEVSTWFVNQRVNKFRFSARQDEIILEQVKIYYKDGPLNNDSPRPPRR